MQKQVSRQNIAIVALSILLTIAIALTFTFAAFANSATARGTITFQANNYQIIANTEAGGLKAVTVEEDAGTDNEGFTYKFTAVVDVDGVIYYNATVNAETGVITQGTVPSFTFKSNKDGAALYCAMKVVLAENSAPGFTIANKTGEGIQNEIITKSVLAGTNTSESAGLTIAIDDLVSGLTIDWYAAGEVDNNTQIVFNVSVECGSIAEDADFNPATPAQA